MTSFSQDYKETYVEPDSVKGENNPYIEEYYKALKNDSRPFSPEKKKMEVKVQAGTSVSSYGKNNTFVSTYTGVGIEKEITSKLSISVGALVVNSNYNNVRSIFDETSGLSAKEKMMNYYVYATGTYKVNERLLISGTTFNEVGQGSPYQDNNFSYNQIGFEYKLGNNVTIGADFSFMKNASQYYNPYYGNNMYGSSYYSPVRSSLFNPAYGYYGF